MSTIFDKIIGKFKKAEAEVAPSQPSEAPVSVDETETKPLEPTPDMLTAAPIGGSGLELPQLIAGCAQSVGQQRDHNEDALFSLTTTLANNASNLPFGLYVVADGMGGHQHGEVASELATRAMAEYVIRKLFTPLFSTHPEPRPYQKSSNSCNTSCSL